MKLISKHIESDRSGYFKVIPEDDNDIWQLYNLILPGDQIESSTHR